jgi:hypothetical protein
MRWAINRRPNISHGYGTTAQGSHVVRHGKARSITLELQYLLGQVKKGTTFHAEQQCMNQPAGFFPTMLPVMD